MVGLLRRKRQKKGYRSIMDEYIESCHMYIQGIKAQPYPLQPSLVHGSAYTFALLLLRKFLPSQLHINSNRKGLPCERLALTSLRLYNYSCHHSSSKPSHPNLSHVTLLSPTRRRLCQALTVTSDKRHPAPSLHIYIRSLGLGESCR